MAGREVKTSPPVATGGADMPFGPNHHKIQADSGKTQTSGGDVLAAGRKLPTLVQEMFHLVDSEPDRIELAGDMANMQVNLSAVTDPF